ncbi:MAG: hypothetical protein RJA22_1410 [Verrucomicrobiota bacterium]
MPRFLQLPFLLVAAGHCLLAPAVAAPGFSSLSARETGVLFTNRLADASGADNQVRLGGSGVALGDMDGDGWCDVYLCGLEEGNALYRNLGGWRFSNVTARAGVACAGQYSTGSAFADVDGDGDLDLLVNALGVGTRLFLNDGTGRFAESPQPALRTGRGATSLALADVDGDGDLDLYVANYRTNTIRSTGLNILNVDGRRFIRPEDRDQYEFTPEGLILEHGDVDVLALNDGRGGFRAVAWNGGAFLDEEGRPLSAGPKDWGLSCQFRDVDRDGRPDLYVCNDFWSVDRLWLNRSTNGVVRFQAAPRLMLRQTSTFSMGVDFADLNRDGLDDFMVLDMLSRDHARRLRQQSLMGATGQGMARVEERPQSERNTLFVNRGDGTFAEVAQLAGVDASEWSWGLAFLDVDLDGHEDALITTGHAFDTQDADTEARLAARGPVPNERTALRLLQFPRLPVPNMAFRNRGDLTFEETGAAWGFNESGVSHGLALGDLDNDGDLDVVVNNLNAAASLYRNDAAAPRLPVRLRGAAPNTRGIGARITVRAAGRLPAQAQEVMAGGRYLSGDEGLRTFAAGEAGARFTVEVDWPRGGRSVLTNVAANQVCEVAESAAGPATARAVPAPVAPWFREVPGLGHLHREEPFNPWARQPLLPQGQGRLGPGVSWLDVDGDGRDDLVVGAGRGGALGILRNTGPGGFAPMRVGGPLANAADDFTAVLGWSPAPGTLELLVGQANYEGNGTNPVAALRFSLRGGTMTASPSVPGWPASPGPLAMADVDGDGDLDLFVGGRVVAGRWPEAAASRLFRQEDGVFVLAEEWKDAGLVSGACFSDLDGDGFPELVMACELGPIRIWRNERGRWGAWDPELDQAGTRLSARRGWWAGVATGDFDGDGRLDIVAANAGRNTGRQAHLAGGWRVFHGDLAGAGAVDIVEAIEVGGRLVPWVDLDRMALVLPWLRERYATRAAFAGATLAEILGERLALGRELRADWADSTLFLNRGDRFEPRSLPGPAQWAPAFAVAVADADGDGREDVFLSQNLFDVEPRTSRMDAGQGLWLRGDGQGGFRAMSAAESGVRVDGEQRGAALGDYDGDGRVDLAVVQNSGPTRLYHNERGTPGLRVRLSGRPGNVTGLGAVLRWAGGPARELRAGSGYWSQDSSVVVLPRPPGARHLTVRWPGGQATTVEVPPDAREITVEQ